MVDMHGLAGKLDLGCLVRRLARLAILHTTESHVLYSNLLAEAGTWDDVFCKKDT